MRAFLTPLLGLMFLSGCAGTPLGRAALTSTGFASHVLCDDVFITGRDPEAAFEERVAPMGGALAPLLRRHWDPERREVSVTLAGGFESRARYREGSGCAVLPADSVPAVVPVADLPPDPFDPQPVTAANPALRQVLDRALAAPAAPHFTKALLVLQDGRLLGERYAAGYGVQTPVLGFSASKSMTNALIGILVRQGRLALDQPVPLPAWQDAADPRHTITVEQLLRQVSGLAIEQDNSGFDDNARIMYSVPDKAAAIVQAPLAVPPGTRWNYTDTHFLLLGRVLRDAVGGSAADVQRFAQAELFGPLGMRHVVMDFDASGTPIGSSHFLASARDWARLGQLFLDDGMAGGRRILPPGWVAMSATPTLDTGYGAGWWTNRVSGLVPGWGVPWGLPSAPADAFFARGFMGQFVVVIPSRRMVIVRLSVSHERGDDIGETDRLVREVLAATAP